jgi:nitroimidazol reductase NimA-like FMN-containing flavoprotein (pyridoxamine 5'-phosphate oxidase superfamily)
MRKHRQEISDPAELETILKGAVICRLAMMDGSRPYLLPFNYGYRDGAIYIHAASEGKKIDVLRKHPEVCFEVEDEVGIIKADRACKWSTRYRSVLGYGRVEIIEDKAGKQEGLEVIMAQHGGGHLVEFEPGNMKQMLILKVDIQSMSGKKSSNWEKS